MAFEDVKLSWKGRDYVLPADAMLRTIAQVEDILPLGRLYESMFKKSLPIAKLSMCYGIMLRAAGVEASDDEVYTGLFEDGGKSMQAKAMQAIALLQALMIPPDALRSKEDKPAKGEPATGSRAASSPSATSSSSGKAG